MCDKEKEKINLFDRKIEVALNGEETASTLKKEINKTQSDSQKDSWMIYEST